MPLRAALPALLEEGLLEHGILPALKRLGLPGPDAPDLTAGDAAAACPLIT